MEVGNMYVGDLETLVNSEYTYAWASCLVNIETLECEHIGNDLTSMFEFLKDKNTKVYFHNLKFDGEFILSWLFQNGYTYSEERKPMTFSTIISEMGVFYGIDIIFSKKYKRFQRVQVFDSLKKLPFSVSDVARAFDLPMTKGEIDYNLHRERDHVLTDEEKDYIIRDCEIVAQALKIQFEKDLKKMTVGSDALSSYKDSVGGDERFRKIFPVLNKRFDDFIRSSYKGGFTYLNPKYKEKRLQGITYDVNSLYPSVMYNELLPFGHPRYFEGEYVHDRYHPLYIQRILVCFKLKKNKIPTIQMKNSMKFIPTEYLESSDGEIVGLTLTNVDLELFLDHYNIEYIEYVEGFKFQAKKGMFKQYIDHWGHIKENSEGAMRTLAKLMLNSLYGKFATNPQVLSKIPYFENGIVYYEQVQMEDKEPVYTAMGSFITAYARKKTIDSAQVNYDRFIYADTDSIHLVGHEEPTNIEIHDSKLGAWKCEGAFTDSLFIRAKTYMEYIDGHWDIKCAGMPSNVKEQVTTANFRVGATYTGKLVPRRIKGGVYLKAVEFTIS